MKDHTYNYAENVSFWKDNLEEITMILPGKGETHPMASQVPNSELMIEYGPMLLEVFEKAIFSSNRMPFSSYLSRKSPVTHCLFPTSARENNP